MIARMFACVVAVALALWATAAYPATLIGDAKAESGQSFVFAAGPCSEGLSVEWREASGGLAAREKVALEGAGWVRYRLERPNVGQLIEAQRVGNRLNLRHVRDGKVKEQQLTVSDDLVAGPLLIRRLQAALPRLRAGGLLELDYLIADQGAVLRLRIQRDTGKRDAGPLGVVEAPLPAGLVRLRMEAASPWMRPFVPQTFLTFDAQGELAVMEGRFLPVGGTAERAQPLAGVLNLRPMTFDPAQSLVAMQSICNSPDLS